ncbi:MAG: AAA family ATPase [Gallionella sp.]|nr:AAA family ATPase [Gallionella sp.]MDD4960583.1 AAA family ATPase [Gallionella sp.]
MPTEFPLIPVLLENTACYDHAVESLSCVETHISWVILTGSYAYKIKKPVNLGFLDFSTLALRQQDCMDELRLNRRLAADYYLGVVAITGTDHTPRVNGTGEALEYAVKMRQFSPDATLDKLAARGELTEAHIDPLAARIARFHLTQCDIAAADSPWGEIETIAQPVAENFQTLTTQLTDTTEFALLSTLQQWCADELTRLTPLMRARKRGGWIRECHGDLHLANVAWVDDQPVIFDCLEFSPALRWIDVMSEVAFCYMDLLHRREAALAARFLNAWLEATGDYAGVVLLRYYAVYRALVRAKVAALRLGLSTDALVLQSARFELSEYLQLAKQLSVLAAPQLWITQGLSGSGKTTVSQRLLQQHGLIRLRSDVERKRLAVLDADINSGSGIQTGLYAADFSQRTYQRLAELAEALLKSGWQIIVDAAFLQRPQRDLFRELARKLRANFQIFATQADPKVLYQRIKLRLEQGKDASEANESVLANQLSSYQPLEADELSVTTKISSEP